MSAVHSDEIPALPPVPAELEAKIDEVITHYPVSKRSAVLTILHLLQENLGFLGAGEATFLPFFAVGIALQASRFPTMAAIERSFEAAHGARFGA